MFKKNTKSNFTKIIMWSGLIFSLFVLTIFVQFSAGANSRAGHTIVIHNNTGATLYVFNWSRWFLSDQPEGWVSEGGATMNAANISIAPNSKKSLFNFLDVGKNILVFDPKRVSPKIKRRFYFVNVSGRERNSKELYIFPRDFGKTAMFDEPVNVNVKIRSGYYWNTIGDSGHIQDLGGGKYKFRLWQGKKRKPEKTNWYNMGTGTMGQNGLIHSTQPAVDGYRNSEYTFEGYWKIIDSGTIELVKYRNYLKKNPPNSEDDWGWKEGPVVYEIVTR